MKPSEVTMWTWTVFCEMRPKIEVGIRESYKVKNPVIVPAEYEVSEDHVTVCFEWCEETYYLSIHKFEIGACLNSPLSYEPTINRGLAEAFYKLTLRLAEGQ